jgi:uncharacterized SAM-binding protein YcdF (DUF218 family)
VNFLSQSIFIALICCLIICAGSGSLSRKCSQKSGFDLTKPGIEAAIWGGNQLYNISKGWIESLKLARNPISKIRRLANEEQLQLAQAGFREN